MDYNNQSPFKDISVIEFVVELYFPKKKEESTANVYFQYWIYGKPVNQVHETSHNNMACLLFRYFDKQLKDFAWPECFQGYDQPFFAGEWDEVIFCIC